MRQVPMTPLQLKEWFARQLEVCNTLCMDDADDRRALADHLAGHLAQHYETRRKGGRREENPVLLRPSPHPQR